MAETSRIKDIPDNEMTDAQKKVFADLVAGRGRLGKVRLLDESGCRFYCRLSYL